MLCKIISKHGDGFYSWHVALWPPSFFSVEKKSLRCCPVLLPLTDTLRFTSRESGHVQRLPTSLCFFFFISFLFFLGQIIFFHTDFRLCSVKDDSECQLCSLNLLHCWFWILSLASPWLFYKNWMSEIKWTIHSRPCFYFIRVTLDVMGLRRVSFVIILLSLLLLLLFMWYLHL